ncbi:MAG: hypothetical protein K2X49_27530 [Acetobacteraceae bacterium]|nr:hypothetical protein [Acetobacteraceae bacterium]
MTRPLAAPASLATPVSAPVIVPSFRKKVRAVSPMMTPKRPLIVPEFWSEPSP